MTTIKLKTPVNPTIRLRTLPAGPVGPSGDDGADGADGAAASIAVGTVTTGAAGSSASVTNVGTSAAAVFDFAIPRGDTGATGSTGATGATGSTGPAAWAAVVAWSTGLTCVATDPKTVVTYSGETYVCNTSHTSGATFAGDSEKWTKVAAKGSDGAGAGDMLKADNLSGLADYATARGNMGLTIGTHVQAYSANLASWSALATSAKQDAAANLTSWAALATSAKQDAAANLTSWAALATSAKQDAFSSTQLPYGKQAIPVMASAMTIRTTNGPAAATSTETSTNKIMGDGLDFDASTIEYAQFMVPLPKQWNESTVTFKPIWKHAATTTNFKVSWGLQAVALSDDDALDTAFGTAQYSNDEGGTTGDVYVGPESSAITVGNTPSAEDFVVFQVLRKADDGTNDTMAIDATLLGIVVYITTDAANDG